TNIFFNLLSPSTKAFSSPSRTLPRRYHVGNISSWSSQIQFPKWQDPRQGRPLCISSTSSRSISPPPSLLSSSAMTSKLPALDLFRCEGCTARSTTTATPMSDNPIIIPRDHQSDPNQPHPPTLPRP